MLVGKIDKSDVLKKVRYSMWGMVEGGRGAKEEVIYD